MQPTEDFYKAAQQMPDPAIWAPQPEAESAPIVPATSASKHYTENLEKFNNQNNGIGAIHHIADLQRNDDNPSDPDNIASEQERYRRFSAAMTLTENFSTNAVWKKLAGAVSLPAVMNWSAQERMSEWDTHLRATRETEVPLTQVRLDPITQQPMTRAQIDALIAQGNDCEFVIPAEDLLRDEAGGFVMNARGTHYINARKIQESDSSLERVQRLNDISAKARQIMDGAAPERELNQEELTMYLSGQDQGTRNQLYQKMNMSPEDITKAEEAIIAYSYTRGPGILKDISGPDSAISYPEPTINDGTINAGDYTIDSLNNTFRGAAYGLSSPATPFTSPAGFGTATSVSIQPKPPEAIPGM